VVWFEPAVIVRYYFKPNFRSFYIFGGPAAAVGTGLLEYEEVLGAFGFGVAAGAGYQFSRNFQVKLGAILTSGSNTSFRSFHATVNLVGY